MQDRFHLLTPALLLRLGPWHVERTDMEDGTFRDGMSTRELVDSTRAWWRVNPERVRSERIDHAVAVHDGLTRAVLEIGTWWQCTRRPWIGRWAFSATLLTEGPAYDEWVGPHGVQVDSARGAQNPVRYSTSL